MSIAAMMANNKELRDLERTVRLAHMTALKLALGMKNATYVINETLSEFDATLEDIRRNASNIKAEFVEIIQKVLQCIFKS